MEICLPSRWMMDMVRTYIHYMVIVVSRIVHKHWSKDLNIYAQLHQAPDKLLVYKKLGVWTFGIQIKLHPKFHFINWNFYWIFHSIILYVSQQKSFYIKIKKKVCDLRKNFNESGLCQKSPEHYLLYIRRIVV